jgi:flavodoxin
MSDPNRPSVLVAFFSRAGVNYFNGGRRDLKIGNTQIVAELIATLVDADLHQIQPSDPYPRAYDPTVARNVEEQRTDTRPAIDSPLAAVDRYDVILLGSPIWNVRPPMIMKTFTEAYDLAGKSIYPFTTHAMSGLGRAVEDYTDACPGANIGDGLAVRGEEVDRARPDVEAWLTRIGLLDT